MSSTPPDPATDEVAFSTRTPGPSRRRVAAIAGGALALAVGAVATSLAASPAPSGAPTTNGTVPAPFLAADPSLIEEGIDLDHGRFGGKGFREITISAISGSNVTLATDDGWTRTIAVTDAVDLTKGGQDIALSDLKVGDQVRFRQTRNDDGTFTVDALAVVIPSVRGTVSDVSSTGFKLTGRDGAVWTITVERLDRLPVRDWHGFARRRHEWHEGVGPGHEHGRQRADRHDRSRWGAARGGHREGQDREHHHDHEA